MKRITVGLDVITLDTDIATSSKQYRIIGVDTALKKVKVDREPNLSGSSAWKIRHRPQLVLIDAFGARINGYTATSTEISKQIKLSDLSKHQIEELKKINENFDTIELDINAFDKPLFRILKSKVKESTKEALLTVNATLQDIPTSGVKWHIPAGVGGRRDSRMKSPRDRIKKTPGKAGSGGWDHYDGQMFVIAEDYVKKSFPWSSYTSRGIVEEGKYNLSSIEGNQNYKIDSYYSNNREFIFRVTDRNSHLIGNLIERLEGEVGKHNRPIYKVDTQLKNELAPSLADALENSAYNGKQIIFYSESNQPFDNSNHWVKNVRLDTKKLALSKKSNPPSGPSAWRVIQYDGCQKAYYYFPETVRSDSVEEPHQIPPYGAKNLGKRWVRLHYGNKRFGKGEKRVNGSAGCLVSPYFVDFRKYLIQLHFAEYRYFYESQDGRRKELRLLAISPKQKAIRRLSQKLKKDKSLGKKIRDSHNEWKNLNKELKNLSPDESLKAVFSELTEDLKKFLGLLEKSKESKEIKSRADGERLKNLVLSFSDVANLLDNKEIRKNGQKKT